MMQIHPEPPEHLRRRAIAFAAILLLAPCAASAWAQSPSTNSASENSSSQTYKTFYLTNANRQHDLNDVQTDLRNLLPRAKLYAVPSQSAISIRGSAEDLALAQKVLDDLDRPRKAYRLTYTITETGSAQPDGSQHVTVIVTSGGSTDFKQGSKVPIVTGSFSQNGLPPHTDVQYQDVGLEIEATLNGYADGVHLRSKIEQSSVAEEKSGVGAQDPTFRQTTLDTTTPLVPGKSLTLGSLDIPGANRHLQVEVVAEPIP